MQIKFKNQTENLKTTFINKSRNSIFLEPTNPEEIVKIISSLKPKSSSGYDNIN